MKLHKRKSSHLASTTASLPEAGGGTTAGVGCRSVSSFPERPRGTPAKIPTKTASTTASGDPRARSSRNKSARSYWGNISTNCSNALASSSGDMGTIPANIISRRKNDGCGAVGAARGVGASAAPRGASPVALFSALLLALLLVVFVSAGGRRTTSKENAGRGNHAGRIPSVENRKSACSPPPPLLFPLAPFSSSDVGPSGGSPLSTEARHSGHLAASIDRARSTTSLRQWVWYKCPHPTFLTLPVDIVPKQMQQKISVDLANSISVASSNMASKSRAIRFKLRRSAIFLPAADNAE
mmetsp:Transcript_29654/g.48926  ORF Transcript_29654/g.48926 Transcript_29654/m.48926 type:complete len:297 (+) Transcript_29654:60-950(+)